MRKMNALADSAALFMLLVTLFLGGDETYV